VVEQSKQRHFVKVGHVAEVQARRHDKSADEPVNAPIL
jgi:hypothetical protein